MKKMASSRYTNDVLVHTRLREQLATKIFSGMECTNIDLSKKYKKFVASQSRKVHQRHEVSRF